MAKISLPSAVSGYNLSIINDNFDALEAELQDKVLYRKNPSGEPNRMENSLDMNSNRILNLPIPANGNEPARLQDVQNAIAGATEANLLSFTQSGTGAVETTIQAKLQERVSILDFGASTTASAAVNAAAITAAIAAASSIYIPAGTYTCNAITVLSGKTIYGDGPASVLSFPAGQTGLYGVATGGGYLEGITLSSFKLLGAVGASGFSEFVHLMNLNGVRNLTIENMHVVGFQGDGLYLGTNGDSLHNFNVRVSGCLFDGVNKDNRNGISCIDIDGIIIQNNVFQNMTRSNMPGFIDFEPNGVFSTIRNINISGNHFSNTDCGVAGIVVAIRHVSATAQFQNFNFTNNTVNIDTRALSITVAVAQPLAQNIVISGNNINAASIGEYYPIINGMTISNNYWACSANGVIGFNNTDTITGVSVTGNIFDGLATSNRAFTLSVGSGHIVANNSFRNMTTYGFLVGVLGGTVSNTSITGNLFRSCGDIHVGRVSGTIDGATCSYLDNVGDDYSSHEFNAWTTDCTGSVVNSVSPAVSFNSDTIPDSFLRLSKCMSTINGDTGVPNTGGYQGVLITNLGGAKPAFKYVWQEYYPANNSTNLGSYYTRKSTAATAWAAGQSITIHQYRSNAGKVYRSETTGTTGATAPTHSSGSVSDGAVTWRYVGTGGNAWTAWFEHVGV